MFSAPCRFGLYLLCRVPADERYRIWSSAISTYSVSPYKGFVCVKHFHGNDLVVGKGRITLKKNAVPNIFSMNDRNDTIVNAPTAPTAPTTLTNTNGTKVPQSIRVYTNRKVVLNRRQNLCNVRATNLEDIQPKTTDAAEGSDQSLNQCEPNKDCDTCHELKNQNDIMRAEYGNLNEEYIDLETRKGIEIAALEKKIMKLKLDADIRKQHIKYLSSRVYKKQKSEESLKLLLQDLQKQSLLSTQAYATLAVIVNFFIWSKLKSLVRILKNF